MTQPRTKYFIEMKNPERAKKLKDRGRSKAGHSVHKIRRLDTSSGKYKKLPIIEEILYRAARSGFKDELSFDVFKSGSAKLIFTIRKKDSTKKGWTFAEEPFSFSKGSEYVESSQRISDTTATMTIMGSGDPKSFVEYAIHFIDDDGNKQTHDPIVRNGQGIPLIGTLAEAAEHDPSLVDLLTTAIHEYSGPTSDDLLQEFVQEMKSLTEDWNDEEEDLQDD